MSAIRSILSRVKPTHYALCTGAVLTAALITESEHASEIAMVKSSLLASHDASPKTSFDDDTETDALRLMQTQPSFPHLLVLPPQDDPTCVMNRVLGDGTRIDLDVHGTMLPIPPLHSLRHAWVGILRCLRSIQYTVESGFNDASYQSKIRAHQRTVVTTALQQVREFDVADSISLYIAADRAALVRALDPTELSQLHLWFQGLCNNHLAHVVWTTSMADVVGEFVVDQSQHDVCLLVRPQGGRFDNRDAAAKLSALMATYGLDGSDDDRQRILDTVGNSWVDLDALCAAIANGAYATDLVQQTCDGYQRDVAQSLRTFLHLDNNALDQADKATQVDAVEKWQVFQRLCGLGSDLQMLAGPQALMKRDKRVAVNVGAVLELFSGAAGDRRFWEMIAAGWMQLQPQSDVDIGVVPCAPVELCRECHVALRPVVEAAFRCLWMDDVIWKQMHALQHKIDVDSVGIYTVCSG
ncbi:hypothetical protein, variant [Aphanomyces astaci]|uniref:Uncharacterized protein n=1 Tax=Aphanomyces astaci TaxID=112090 RepID=W4HAF6_APHAT|nr:hypothetical protein, variant [Aphanomyces astaci]ETV89015.1 hypothetical protein, variant [Aphanomyces astaci]|eukprot:XP_009821415.1 hypothetical protein, variant [Aphanomyces astaci]